MPIAGAKPKPEGQKRHRVRPVADWVEVVNEAFAGGPLMPAKMHNGRTWPTATRRWWRAMSTMPHCRLWTDADWSFALDTLAVAGEFHSGEMRVAAELRNREKILGATLDARRDLRIRYVDHTAESEESSGVTSLDDYRSSID